MAAVMAKDAERRLNVPKTLREIRAGEAFPMRPLW
jgi:hypothetical protein